MYEDAIRFAEIRFFFLKSFGTTSEGLAVVSLYAQPDDYLLRSTHETLCVCRHQGDTDIVIINVKSILSVVAMVPFPFVVGGRSDQYFMIERIGLDIVETDFDSTPSNDPDAL